jgi:5-methyltetrahydropteroyltriglutamate--homocysteine methyltransferase
LLSNCPTIADTQQETRELKAGEGPPRQAIGGRDVREFPEYFAPGTGRTGAAVGQDPLFCVGPLTYTGQAAVQFDIETFKAALQGANANEAFLPAIAPGTVEHWLRNEHYASDEAYLFALADILHEEYKAITDAGLVLQIDDPDLADGWQIHHGMTVPEYQKFAELRIDALNHALRDIPEEQVRFHMCWGSYHGPHKFDIPLSDLVDLILKVKAQTYSIEASNSRHEHEWTVWENANLPDGKMLMPGVIGHESDFIEHPELVAQRLVRYANLVGRENVIAGTDCGIGSRVGHGSICWAKFEAMVEGAAIATKQLWGR